MASSRPPLSPDERAALTSTAARERLAAGQPFRLENRSIAELEIAGEVLEGIELRDIDFENVRMKDTAFHRARLENVWFSACELRAVSFEESGLSACRFSESHLDQVGIVRCDGAEWRTDICRIDELRMEDSAIDGWVDFHGAFEEAKLLRCRIASPDWKSTRLTRPEVSELSLGGGKLESVLFENGSGSGIVVRGASIDGFEVLLGDYAGMTFEAVTGRSLRLTDVRVRGLGLVGCSELAGISVSGLVCAGFVIDRCQPLAMLTIGHSDIEAFSLTDSQIAGSIIRSSRLFGESNITGGELDGFDFGGSTFEDVVFRRTSIGTLLRMVGAKVRGLKLEAVQYQPDLEVEAAGATFSDGDTFPQESS